MAFKLRPDAPYESPNRTLASGIVVTKVRIVITMLPCLYIIYITRMVKKLAREAIMVIS